MLIQKLTTSIRPLTTAHLAQTMTLLELTSEELRQKIEAELASNPALELAQEARCPHCRRLLQGKGSCPVCSSRQNMRDCEPIVFVSPRSDFVPSSDRQSGEADFSSQDMLSAIDDLPSFVLRQIAFDLDEKDRMLAAHILNSLDDDGLLAVPLTEIARYHFVPIERVRNVLRIIQHADPIGVGSPTPQEALLVQLETLAETRQVPPLAKEAINLGIELLSRYAYVELGRLLKISAAEAENIANFISDNLNPYPARSHWGNRSATSASAQVYYDADILINRLDNSPNSPLVVEIISPYAGSLRVNPLFRAALTEAPVEKVEQWQNDLESASLLVKCLQQRDNTLVRLMQRLVSLQRDFLLEGDAYLQPITRAQLAKELNVHESTISRAVASKAVQLPNRRIIPMSKLFDRSLHIRTALLQIIAEERRPLSDSQIAELLEKNGYLVARRTVAKYRSIEGILPARMRRIHACETG